jgi:hypothetical protein
MELLARTCVAMELKGFKPQELANTINGEAAVAILVMCSGLCADDSRAGFAKLGHQPGARFMELLVRKCVAMELQGFNPQNFANTINGEAAVTSVVMSSGLCADESCAGFAKLGHQPGAEFMKLFVRECEDKRFKDFEPQDLANTINGEVEGCAHSNSQVLGLMRIYQ